MSPPPDSASSNPEQLIADLRRELAECRVELDKRTAERDEALEQQTATAEVLQVINSSPGELATVFDEILEKAHTLCAAPLGSLAIFDGENVRAAATRGYPEEYDVLARRGFPARGFSISDRLLKGESFIHFPDVEAVPIPASEHPIRRAAREIVGVRAGLYVPLRKDGNFLGYISAQRQEPLPFSEKQIALLQNFAAQAVIAMENARLISETREALEQQTATAEVLQVINSSPGDLTPVFDAILDKALGLCGAAFGVLWTYNGTHLYAEAHRGASSAYAEVLSSGPYPADATALTKRFLKGEPFAHGDVAAGDGYHLGKTLSRALVDLDGGRTNLAVPLRREDALLGFIVIYRREVRPFTEKQIGLLQNFAAQAVIAMDNARLLTETREALEQQTATAEVLQVINSSPGDLAPVFDAILEKAHTLCGATRGSLFLFDGALFRAVATQGYPSDLAAHLRQGVGISPVFGAPLLADARIVHTPDLTQVDDPIARAVSERGGVRTNLLIPLRREGALLGAISCNRHEVRPFSDQQIALLENFAAQAIIAMENARLLTETREALEQQTATAEVLQVINSSPGDLAPVFDAILEKAHSLCSAPCGSLQVFDGEQFRAVSVRGLPEPFAAMLREGYRPDLNAMRRQMLGPDRGVAQITDFRELLRSAPDDTVVRAGVEVARLGTVLFVPLLKDQVFLGRIVAARQEVRLFSDKQIALLENFAAQAVIAMENARLLGELRERTHDLEESLEYQTATSDVLQVISRSTFDLQPVLQTVLDTAVRLCRAGPSEIFRLEGDGYRFAVGHGMTPEYEVIERTVVIHPDPGTLVGRTALERRVVHVLDAWTDPLYSQKEEARIGNFHTMLGVPLMREGEVAGVIALSRRVVEPFSEREVQLVTTFADQAVIAIENTRLITETREALEQQTATAEILRVINRSPGDLTPVFEAILDKAHTLCGATLGSLFLFDGELSRAAATHGYPDDLAQRLRQGVILSSVPQLLEGAPWLHNPDLRLVDNPTARAVSGRGGVRTNLMLPLRKDGRLLGTISCNRQEVRPFTDKEIELLESFAAQAVIAMDNARLLDEIRQRQAELRVTFDNMGDGVAMFDSDQRLAAWNLNFQRILDVPDELLAERPSYSEYIRFLAQRGEFGDTDIETELSRRLEGLGQELRFEHTRPDGRVIEVRRNAVPGGGFVIIYGDVTERKRAEAEIRAARDTAERALQELQTAQASLLHAQKMASLGQLTAGIAHEIKNPLNFVNNFAGLSVELLDELREAAAPAVASLDDDTRAGIDETIHMLTGNLEKIAEHGKRADGIVKSMLEHSRGVSGERREVDLNTLVEEALNLAYHGARAQDASFNITLERDLDPAVAPIELAPQDMTRVFLNLFGNGFYAANKRARGNGEAAYRPTLQVSTHDLGAAVEVRVRDNGIGIPPEIRDQLFQPFFTTKPTGEGTGLGLSISWDIVTQQHGGTITVDSREGEFTELTIRLPRNGQAAGRSA